MADPLSIAAGAVGLLTAAAHVSHILHGIITKARNAPEDIERIKNEIDDIRNVLGALQLYLNGTQRARRSRTSLIMVDQVVATLAACVTTFSDLDAFATTLESETDLGIINRLRWSNKEKEIKTVLVRLGAHKSSLQLMLTILSCQSQDEAESKVDRLCDLVEQMLSQNLTLKARLAALEIVDNSPDLDLALDSKMYSPVFKDSPQSPQITSPDSAVAFEGLPHWQRNDRGFVFDEMLMNSRAYRLARNHNSDAFSVVSSAGRTASWSMLSGLSLSEVSHIGIQAIPIYATDITNNDHYDFNPAAAMTSTWTQPTDKEIENVRKSSTRSWLKNLLRVSQTVETVEEPSSTIFGVPLKDSVSLANVAIALHDEEGNSYVYGYIPLTVAKAGVFLKAEATRTEDIFALNGNPVRTSRLQQVFNTAPLYGKGISWDDYTVHDAASIFLRYLKTLPEPLVPYEKYEKFITQLQPFTERDLNEDDSAAALHTAQELIRDLPPLNRQLLLYVLDMIGVFAYKAEENKMTAMRLISSFQPSILANVPSEMDADAHHVAAQVALVLVNNENELMTADTKEK